MLGMKMVSIFKRPQIKFFTIIVVMFSLVFTIPLTSVNGQAAVNSTTPIPKWDSHMTFVNNTPFPLKFHIEAADDCTANASQTCDASAMKAIYYNVYICPGVYPFDDNGTLTEGNCNIIKYQFNKASPEVIKALEEIALALTEAEIEDNAVDEAALKTLNQTVGGVAPYFAGKAYLLSWKSDVNGDKTVTASLDPSTGRFSLSD
jgi:hypothetical protein